MRIITAVAERLGLPPEKVFTNIDRYGNTSAASVPIALYEALEAGRIRDRDIVMLNACGGGLTWGANIVRW
jgi:3-oxoacyl-[acyl-carrier-protein] synthase-3